MRTKLVSTALPLSRPWPQRRPSPRQSAAVPGGLLRLVAAGAARAAAVRCLRRARPDNRASVRTGDPSRSELARRFDTLPFHMTRAINDEAGGTARKLQ